MFPSPATKVYLEASGEDPKLARVELASLVDKFNALLAEVQTATSQAQYDIAHPIHSILIMDWDTAPQVPSGISATWTAIVGERVLMNVASGAGDTGGASTVNTGSAGGHDHGGNTGFRGQPQPLLQWDHGRRDPGSRQSRGRRRRPVRAPGPHPSLQRHHGQRGQPLALDHRGCQSQPQRQHLEPTSL